MLPVGHILVLIFGTNLVQKNGTGFEPRGTKFQEFFPQNWFQFLEPFRFQFWYQSPPPWAHIRTPAGSMPAYLTRSLFLIPADLFFYGDCALVKLSVARVRQNFAIGVVGAGCVGNHPSILNASR